MAFASTGISSNNYPLFAMDKVKLGQFHDLCFIDPFLKVKIKIGQQLALREL